MKIYKYFTIIALALILFACEKDTEGISKVTFYCELSLKGDAVEFAGIGDSYNEPGWIATENGVDVSENVVVSGTVNTSTAGVYTLTYAAYNSDGFAVKSTRKVVVYDKASSPIESGFYYVSRTSYRNTPTSNAEFASEPEVFIYQKSPGLYYVSDLFGGYYAIGRGYGSNYAVGGNVNFNGTDFSLISGDTTPWGDTFSAVEGSFDAATNTISLNVSYASYVFYLKIIKK